MQCNVKRRNHLRKQGLETISEYKGSKREHPLTDSGNQQKAQALPSITSPSLPTRRTKQTTTNQEQTTQSSKTDRQTGRQASRQAGKKKHRRQDGRQAGRTTTNNTEPTKNSKPSTTALSSFSPLPSLQVFGFTRKEKLGTTSRQAGSQAPQPGRKSNKSHKAAFCVS